MTKKMRLFIFLSFSFVCSLLSYLPSHVFSFLSFFPHYTAVSCSHNKCFKCYLFCLYSQPLFHSMFLVQGFFFFKQLIVVLNTANSCTQFGLVSLPFIWPLLMALRISERTTQGSRTKINSPKSVVPQWLKEVLEEGLADKILRGWLEG